MIQVSIEKENFKGEIIQIHQNKKGCIIVIIVKATIELKIYTDSKERKSKNKNINKGKQKQNS